MTISDIKNGLINSCLTGTPHSFIPFLLSPNVKTKMPNKIRFYSFYKYMLRCAKKDSAEPWFLKIEKITWMNDKNSVAFKFYDQKHKYAKLTIIVKEIDKYILLDTLPL